MVLLFSAASASTKLMMVCRWLFGSSRNSGGSGFWLRFLVVPAAVSVPLLQNYTPVYYFISVEVR